MPRPDESLEIGVVRDALAHGDWERALHVVRGLPADPEVLELTAQAAYGTGAFEDAVGAWESLVALHERAGEPAAAARAALMAAMLLLVDTGMMAPVRVWVRRAERLLHGLGEVPAQALVPTVLCQWPCFNRSISKGMCRQAPMIIPQVSSTVEAKLLPPGPVPPKDTTMPRSVHASTSRW